MTGISRIREAFSRLRPSCRINQIIDRLCLNLEESWQEENCSITFTADSIRTVGLLQPLMGSNTIMNSFELRSRKPIVDSLASENTQRILAAFYTVKEMARMKRDVKFAIHYIREHYGSLATAQKPHNLGLPVRSVHFGETSLTCRRIQVLRRAA